MLREDALGERALRGDAVAPEIDEDTLTGVDAVDPEAEAVDEAPPGEAEAVISEPVISQPVAPAPIPVEAPAVEAPPPLEEAVAAPAPASRRPGFPRIALFVAALLLLALAGVANGRHVRDDGGPAAEPTTTAAATTSTPGPVPVPQKPAAPAWGPLRASDAGRLAEPTARAAAVTVGGRAVVLGGTSAAVQVAAPGTPFRRVGSLPAPLASPAVLVSGGTLYAIGGQNGAGTPGNGILRIDPATGTVTEAGTFVEPLAGAGFAQSGNGVLIAGGWTGTQYATAVLRFTLPGAAALVARLPEGVRDAAAVLTGGKLYVAGGRTARGLSAAVYAVDLASGGVSVVGRLPRAVAGASLVAAGGQLYLLGGRTASGPVATVVRIDPGSGRIERAGAMPSPLADAAAVRLGGKTLVAGGTQGAAVTALAAG
jgi:hypothetical protein